MTALIWVSTGGGNGWAAKATADSSIGKFDIIKHPKQLRFTVRFKGVTFSKQTHQQIADAKAEAQTFYDQQVNPR